MMLYVVLLHRPRNKEIDILLKRNVVICTIEKYMMYLSSNIYFSRVAYLFKA